MFSNYNSVLVSHSDGMFTRYSASTDRTSGDLQSDLIDFLSIVQKYDVDYLPITWQPALGNIGHGGSGMISQSTFSTDKPLAFKRFHVSESDESDSVFDYLPLISEVMILSQLPIRNHPNIINLQGICWEVKPRTGKAIPVLVFEKAAWDLQQFMNVYEGRNMSIDGRLKLCADIGSAIMALHDYDVIHGDIKPQNVLVFKDTAGKITVKVTDFGYSTFTTPETSSVGRTGSVFLPKSRPWNAPEHHFGDFTALEAKKADVYSFGMLCFWILFGNICMQQNMEYTFDTSTGPRTSLEQIKYDDKMEYVANQLMESVSVGAGLNAKHKSRLQIFFSLTVPLNPEKRTTDIAKLLSLLGQEQWFHLKYYVNTVAKMFRTEPQPFSEGLGIMVTNTELSRHAHFRIAENLVDFIAADYRVRTQIRESLETKYFHVRNQTSASQIAFQIAFCYQIGFGIKSDDSKCHMWLEKSNTQPYVLKIEKEAIRPARGQRGRMLGIEGLLTVDLIHEYQSSGRSQLEKALNEYRREADDMARELGELHFVPLALYEILGDLLDELGEFGESKTLRMKIRDQIGATDGIVHPYYIGSICNVVKSHTRLGEWIEALVLQENVLQHTANTYGARSSVATSTMNNFALTFINLGKWKEAEVLQVQVMESKKLVLGTEHPNTLTSMVNLASTLWKQGRWKEAEVLEIQVIETYKKILGQEHLTTLTGMNNLASTYCDQGRWKEAEVLKVKVMKTFKSVFGQEHPNTLTSMNNLAVTYQKQGRCNEAEELEEVVMETRKRIFGEEHPDTLASFGSLAAIFWKQGRLKEAEELELQGMETSKRVLGQEHPDTLTVTAHLALTLLGQGRWSEAEVLCAQVMETRKRVLGQEHPDTLTSMNCLASIYHKQGRWKEAEVLKVKTVEKRKRVLGQAHPDTMGSMNSLASIYRSQGRWKEAEDVELPVVEIRKRVLGKEHPDTLASMLSLASTFSKQERLKEAEELEVQVMEISKRILGPEHPDTLTCINNLALTLGSQGRWIDAEMLCMEVLQTRRRILGQEHPDTLTSIGHVALTCWNQGRWKDAEVLYLQETETSMRVLGQEHPETLISMGNLASTYKRQGRWQEAEVIDLNAMEKAKSILGREHPDTLVMMGNLASTYVGQGRLQEAKELFVKVMETSSRVLGPEHPIALGCLDNLASIYINQR